jgi:iron complex transport system ATP-binding protein
VAVLHDLNQAARYGTHLVAVKDGRIVAEGAPADVVTADMVEEVFGLRCIVTADPVSGTPSVSALGRDRAKSAR